MKLDNKVSSELPIFKQLAASIVNAKGDSGASRHYIRPEDTPILQNLQPYKGTLVRLPDNSTISPSHTDLLPLLNKLPLTAKQGTVLPALKNSSLISIVQLCDGGCRVLLDKKQF